MSEGRAGVCYTVQSGYKNNLTLPANPLITHTVKSALVNIKLFGVIFKRKGGGGTVPSPDMIIKDTFFVKALNIRAL